MRWFRPANPRRPRSCIVPIAILAAVMAVTTFAQADTDAKILSAPSVTIPETVVLAGVGGKLVFSVSVNDAGDVTNLRLLAGPAWPCAREPKDEVREATKIVRDALAATKFS